MKQSPVLAALMGLALAACSDSSSRDAALPTAPAVMAALSPGACSFRDAQNAARGAFTTTALRRAAADWLRTAEQAAAGSLARNDALFEVFKVIVQAYNANQLSLIQAAVNLHLEILECGAFVNTDARDHEAIITSALTNGIYGYRAGSEGPVVAKNLEVATEPSSHSWTSWVGVPRMMVFGGLVNVDFTEIEVDEGQTYRIGFITDASPPGPTPTPSGGDDDGIVEFCPRPLTGVADNAQWRVGRSRGTGAEAVLQELDITGFCPGSFGALPRPSGFLAGAFHRMVDLFRPAPLQALILAPPGTGGGTGEFDTDFALVNPVSVTVTFTTEPPPTGPQGEAFTVVVHARAAFGTPLENAGIKLAIDGNQGGPAGAFITVPPGTTPTEPIVYTDENGDATFTIALNKPGNYRLRATNVDFAGFGGEFVLSIMFHQGN